MPPAQSDPDPQPLLPSFAPVPRAKERSNGWKPEVQRQFIEALAETGSVKAACRRVNRADHGAYMLRRNPRRPSSARLGTWPPTSACAGSRTWHHPICAANG
jgi:hypothetical protein